jgi:flagellar transcriptional activator FlhC
MASKSVLNDSKQVERAVALIQLGARLQVLESETDLSYERLLRLYKEVAGKSPSKGQLPFSTDWFLTWQPNIHSSLFINIYTFLKENTGVTGIQALIKSYQLYLEQYHVIEQSDDHPISDEPVISLIRAWTLIRFVEQKLLKTETCSCCKGKFVVDVYDLHEDYECNLCNVPSRAGKYQKNKKYLLAA